MLRFQIFKKKLPKVTIEYSKLLDSFFVFYCQNKPELKKGWSDWAPLPTDKLIENVELFRQAWEKDGKRMLLEACSVLNLDFSRNIIPVYVVSGSPRPFGDPVVIRADFARPDSFIDVLVHELIHVLFADNQKKVPWSIHMEMFPNENPDTQNHIIVHAVLKYVYLDVLKDPERLQRDVNRSAKHRSSDYVRAWEIVEQYGYQELITKFLSKYK
ncbi:MAG TPA: hypothetical protein DCS23_00815 [Candidatus Yonathbacteria bacterium]|nr:hypothetical protein [Candidatus Yonathbacteria bacterium]